MRYQQNLSNYAIAVVVLVVRQNKYEVLQPLIPTLLGVLGTVKPGEVMNIGL
jgi:hypothetical protein